ncbi:MAG: endonuclease domain-containing protein [Proteobacteria bacterium]|nr:endonuclease domain-containing protein [Candidatus Enterousia onthequi]
MKLPQNKSLSGLSRALRNNGTKAEAVLWKHIKNKQGYGFQFHRQKNIGQYIVDFYCPTIGLVIEVDGNSHDNKYEYDNKRDKYLENLGLCVLRIDNQDILFQTSKALYYIDSFIVHRINEFKK